jgi:flagellar hook protein FlgE
MGSALSAGVSGLKAFQTMLDVAGNNLANVSTAGYKSTSVSFSDLLSQTIQKAGTPSGGLGGTNPVQVGSGVSVAAIKRNMTQGTIESTGEDLDMAIDGEGFFVLSDGTQNVYTRVGSFAVDSNNTLIDPSTGYKVQRIGTVGEAEEIQTSSESSIHIPWDTALAANATIAVTLNGNLSSSGGTATTNKIVSNLAFTTSDGGQAASASTVMGDLDQWGTTSLGAGTGTIQISGVKRDGTAFTDEEVTFTATDTMGDVLSRISTLFDDGTAAEDVDSTATLNADGQIVITDNSDGYSQTQVTGMTYVPDGAESLEIPTYFDYTTIGGENSSSTTITVYDSTGARHLLTGTFVKTDTTNTWDFVVQSIDGEQAASWADYDILNNESLNRRISGIEFNSDSSLKGLNSTTESLTLGVRFDSNPDVTQTITLDIGTAGEFDGLTQFGSGTSTAAASGQDGYPAGALSSVSIDKDGIIVGTFTNDQKIDVAQIQLAVFQNAGGLEAVGGNYYISTANSGEAVAASAGNGGAGSITSQSLEKSNVDMATEFVNLIQAQNGYQANSRTISVANQVLQELTNLIR